MYRHIRNYYLVDWMSTHFKRPSLGASKMTTQCLTKKFRKIFTFYCHEISQEKQRFRTIFPKISPERKLHYRHIRNYYLSNSKTFQDGNGNGNFGKINSNDFQDGNWESMEIKG